MTIKELCVSSERVFKLSSLSSAFRLLLKEINFLQRQKNASTSSFPKIQLRII